MAQRFGRNQKRRLKAELALAEAKVDQAKQEVRIAVIDKNDAKSEAETARKNQREAERQVDHAKHILPRYSVAAPAKIRDFDGCGHNPPQVVFLEEQRSARGVLPRAGSYAEYAEEMAIKRQPLDVLVAGIDVSPLTGDLHCWCRFGLDRPLVYALSRSAMRKMSPEHQVEELSRAIAMQIVANVMEANGRVGRY